MANLTKVCTICKVSKNVSEFYPAVTSSGNPTIRSRCKNCEQSRNKAKYAKMLADKIDIVIPDLPGEQWVPAKGFEKVYRVSNFGRVKSIDRWVYKAIAGKEVLMKGKLLSQCVDANGYYSVTFYNTELKIKRPKEIHTVVYFSFHSKAVKKKGFEVDHIDNNKLNNNVSNLQYIPCRRNSTKRSLNHPKTSQYSGVHWDKRGYWNAQIKINSKSKSLGSFDDELDAHLAYLNAVKQLTA
jgi:hypothetical protein